jgi:hypothetical protein
MTQRAVADVRSRRGRVAAGLAGDTRPVAGGGA